MPNPKKPTLGEMIDAGQVAAEINLTGRYIAIVDAHGQPDERRLRRVPEPETIYGTWTLPDGSTCPGAVTLNPPAPNPVLVERAKAKIHASLPPITFEPCFGDDDA